MIDMKDRIRQWFGVYVEKGYVNVVSPETLYTDARFSRGIERIRAEGNSFDYNYHEAVSHVTEPFLPENYVKEVIQSRYMKNGVLIRAVKVIVAN